MTAATDLAPAAAPSGLRATGTRRLGYRPDRCKGCGICVAACPEGVLAIDTERVNLLGHHPVRVVHPRRCTSCALCARVCPDLVFTVRAPRAAGRRTG